MLQGWKRAFGLAVCACLLSTSCYGPFNMTRKVHDWNDEVGDNKWVDEAVFLVLNIIPVYGVAVLLDAVIFNSIEFWGGENPVSPEADSDM